jgi:hypothetical protein
MPHTPMGFYSKGFPSQQSVLLSEPLPSCRWASISPTISMEWWIVCVYPKAPATPRLDFRGFPCCESVRLLVVLPTPQGRSSRVCCPLRNSPLLRRLLLRNLLPCASSNSLTEVISLPCTSESQATAGLVDLLSETTALSELLVLVCHHTV